MDHQTRIDGVRRPAGVEEQFLANTVEGGTVIGCNSLLPRDTVMEEVPTTHDVDVIAGLELVDLAENPGERGEIPPVRTAVSVDHHLSTFSGITEEMSNATMEDAEDALAATGICRVKDGKVADAECWYGDSEIETRCIRL